MFAEKLISLRKSKSLTQEELAKILYVSRSAVAKWEQGRSTPDVEILKKIANYFSISLNEFIQDTEVVIVESYTDNIYSPIYNRLKLLLKNEEYTKCNELIETILNKDLKQIEAYLYKIVVDFKLHSLDDLSSLSFPLNKNKYFNYAYEFSSEEEKVKLNELLNKTIENYTNKNNEKLYNLALICEKKKDYQKAEEYYKLLNGYKDANEKIQQLEFNRKKRVYDYAINLLINKKYCEAKELFEYLNDFLDSKVFLEKCQKEELDLAKRLTSYKNNKALLKARRIYTSLANQEKVDEINYKIKHNNKVNLISVFTCLIFSALIIIVPIRVSYSKKQEAFYNSVVQLINKDNLLDAKQELKNLSNEKEKDYLNKVIDVFSVLRTGDYQKAIKLSLDNHISSNAILSYSETNEKVNYDFETYWDVEHIPDFEKNYYDFTGWILDGYYFENNKITINLEAKLSPTQYKIVYKYEEDSIYSDKFIKVYDVNTEAFSLPFLSKKGYEFKGWRYGNKIITKFNPQEYLKDVVLEACFQIINYSITYNLNGGINNPKNVDSYTINDNLTLYAPTKEGYAFKGWSLTNDQTHLINISAQDCVNYILYAIWVKPQYSINYVLNGGENNKNNIELFKFEDKKFTLLEPTKEDYKFLGWYLDEDFSNKIEYLDNSSMEDITLFAKWVKEYSNVYYELDEYALNNPKNVNCIPYYEENEIVLSVPQKTGYVFLGWYENGVEITKIKYQENRNYRLVAKWRERNDNEFDSDLFGEGTEEDPYQIYDIYEYSYISEITSTNNDYIEKYANASYILMNDIDMNNGELLTICFDVWGTQTEFTGTFDGNNHKLYHFDDEYYFGVIGYIGENPTLKNLTLEFQTKDFTDAVNNAFYYFLGDYPHVLNVINCHVTCLNS